MAKLKTETNTEEIQLRVFDAAGAILDPPHAAQGLQPDFEHGQWWISCVVCGAQWSVVDAEGGRSVDGFDFEQSHRRRRILPGERMKPPRDPSAEAYASTLRSLLHFIAGDLGISDENQAENAVALTRRIRERIAEVCPRQSERES